MASNLPRLIGRRRVPLQFLLGTLSGLLLAVVLLNTLSTTQLLDQDSAGVPFALRVARDKEPTEKFQKKTCYWNYPGSHVNRANQSHLNSSFADDETFASHDDDDSRIRFHPQSLDDTHVHKDDDSEAKRLATEVRVLVWVQTHPGNHEKKLPFVKSTWGQRVNKLLMFSTVQNDSIPTIGLNVSEGRSHLAAKSQNAWRYIYKHHFDDADWFMKADDDTYVVVENLRYFLSGENSSDPVMYGHHFQKYIKQGFFSGGSGYVLSKEALRRYGEKGQEILKLCRQDGAAEDLAMSACMEKLGVRADNATDALGRDRFYCFNSRTHLMGQYPKWYYKYRNVSGVQKGMDMMSDYAISFHYVSPQEMLAIDFYVYHLAPYGIIRFAQNLNKPRRSS